MSGPMPSISPPVLKRSDSSMSMTDTDDIPVEPPELNLKQNLFNLLTASKPKTKAPSVPRKISAKIAAVGDLLKQHFKDRVNGLKPPEKIINPKPSTAGTTSSTMTTSASSSTTEDSIRNAPPLLDGTIDVIPDAPEMTPPTTTTSTSTTPSSTDNGHVDISLRNKVVKLEYIKSGTDSKTVELKTTNWFVAGIMNIFAKIFPRCLGAAKFSIDNQTYYVKRSIMQEAFTKVKIEKTDFKGTDVENTARLRAVATIHFKV